MGCCRCCEQTGACCNDGTCSLETCADCEDAGGTFQGVGTECSGVSEDECPCDPPADPALCEKCIDGVATVRCTGSENCCDGTCVDGPCGDCAGDCEWQVAWGLEGTYGWSLVSGCPEPDCLCAEPADDPGTEESPAQEGNYFTPCASCLTDEDCEGGYCCDGVCQDTPCATPCDSASDCPGFGLTCEELLPGSPYNCCDGECEEHACYPGAVITLVFTKKVGCTAAFFAEIPEGGSFEAVISGGSLDECGVTTADLSGAPCLVEWTLSAGCEVSGLSFSAAGDPTCEQCYEYQSHTAGRGSC